MSDYSVKPNDPLFVDDKLTPLTEEEFTYYLNKAFTKVLGYEPPLNSFAILWAHAALEVGRGKYIHSNNWGNIKKHKDVKYTAFKCSEILNGKEHWFVPYHPQTFFASYESPLEGAIAYINFLKNKKRYQTAWNQIILGYPDKYSHELKKAGYYTANEERYTALVVKLCNEFKSKADKLLAYKPMPPQLADTLPPPSSLPRASTTPPPSLPKSKPVLIVFPDLPKSTPTEMESVPLRLPKNSILKFIELILGLIMKLMKKK